MKSKIILTFIIALTFSSFLNAQDKNKQISTDSLVVSGVCSMCEERIENAALIKGVKKVEWDVDTQVLIVTYRKDKVDLEKIAASIAEAGHDNEIIKSTEEQYDKVHSCCKYREIDSH
jgi:copper chaperone CopZ